MTINANLAWLCPSATSPPTCSKAHESILFRLCNLYKNQLEDLAHISTIKHQIEFLYPTQFKKNKYNMCISELITRFYLPFPLTLWKQKKTSSIACKQKLHFQSWIMNAEMMCIDHPQTVGYQPQLLFQWEGGHWNEIKDELLVWWVMAIWYLYSNIRK